MISWSGVYGGMLIIWHCFGYSIITMVITVIVICWMSPIQIIPKSSELICQPGHLD